MDGDCGHAWRTSAGLALVRQIVGHADEGQPVLLRARHCGAANALSGAADDCCRTPVLIEGHAGLTPIACLEAQIPDEARADARGGLLALISSDALRDALLIVEVVPDAFKSWLAFAGTFASARKPFDGVAAALVLLVPEVTPAPRHCVAFNDDAIVDMLDALIFIRERAKWSRSRLAQAVAAVLVEVCRGELDLIARLIDHTPEHMLDPATAVRALGPPKDPRPLHWRGTEEPCPIWLLAKDRRRFDDRVLRGQLSVLFPWLEETRSAIARKGADFLPTGLVDKVTGDRLDVPDYEFAHIAVALGQKRAPKQHVDAANTLRDVRNDLAHGRPISSAMLADAEAAARMLMAAVGR